MIVGILHTEYLQYGGEDQVVAAEMQLLQADPSVTIKMYKLKNPAGTFGQVFSLLQLPFNVPVYYKVLNWLKEENIHVLHVHNWMFAASPSVFRAARAAKVPVVHTLHNYRLICPSATLFNKGALYLNSFGKHFPWHAVWKGVYNNSRILSFWLAFAVWINRKAGTWNAIDRYILLTGNMQEVISRSGLELRPSQLSIKPNFTIMPPVKATSRENHFLFIGRLSEEKGIAVLLDAFKGSDFVIRIIGKGPLKEMVEEAALNYPDNIEYCGFQDKERIYEELQVCTALVFSSVWYETFGLTIIEAFACGTPVIASAIGAATELIKDTYNGMHFKPGDAGDLRTKLAAYYLLSPGEKKQMSENSFKTYEAKYSPANNLRQLLEIYRKLFYKAESPEKLEKVKDY